MMNQLKSAAIAAVIVCGGAFLATPLHAGNIVNPGYDLFRTDPAGTSFMGVNFRGIALNTFDFGGTIGVKNTGPTDTIVHRLSSVSGPSGSTPIELIALQLRSVSRTSFGGMLPFDYYYVTLQTNRTPTEVGLLGAGTQSTGTLTINFGPEPADVYGVHGTFDATSYNAYFDVRRSSLTGEIVFSDDVNLDSSGTNWAHELRGAYEILNVNDHLNGTDDLADFWPIAPIDHDGPHDVIHPNPEPSTMVLAGLGLVGAAYSGFRRQRHRCR